MPSRAAALIVAGAAGFGPSPTGADVMLSNMAVGAAVRDVLYFALDKRRRLVTNSPGEEFAVPARAEQELG